MGAVGPLAGGRQVLEGGKKIPIDEPQQVGTSETFGVSGPGALLQVLWNGRAVAALCTVKLLVLVVDDFEEEHPTKLREALGVAIDTCVFPHRLLNGFDCFSDGHG